ncbi:uncharacterized protein LOC123312997 [Coccinella septempunctata]|uniref:uncharacterized protein LOC123312997 n=1 Tax=Coccinella septempunctata TaxID=41139 RepID=UPI001D05D027|nr:uncharacterized protein LOC123312997 [Coccinella septempunctata]
MTTRQKSEFEKSLIEALKSDSVIKEISNAIINTISRRFAEKFNDYEAKIATLEAEIQLLKSNTDKIETNFTDDTRKKLQQKVDYLEQRAKNNNIRLIGIKESQEENLLTQVKKLFKDKLNITVADEITSVYRSGAANKNHPRHLIVVFKNSEYKNVIFKNKKLLKGSNIVMKEDLTHDRWKLVRESSEKYGFKNVWTFNGAVFVKSETGVKKLISGV